MSTVRVTFVIDMEIKSTIINKLIFNDAMHHKRYWCSDINNRILKEENFASPNMIFNKRKPLNYSSG